MNSIDKIEIKIRRLINPLEIVIIPNTLMCYVNGKEKGIKEKTIDRLLSIVCLWDKDAIDNSSIDDDSYSIKIYAQNGVDIIEGRSVKQPGYMEFMKLVGGLDG